VSKVDERDSEVLKLTGLQPAAFIRTVWIPAAGRERSAHHHDSEKLFLTEPEANDSMSVNAAQALRVREHPGVRVSHLFRTDSFGSSA
jgi:hypothetical protein